MKIPTYFQLFLILIIDENYAFPCQIVPIILKIVYMNTILIEMCINAKIYVRFAQPLYLMLMGCIQLIRDKRYKAYLGLDTKIEKTKILFKLFNVMMLYRKLIDYITNKRGKFFINVVLQLRTIVPHAQGIF